MISLCAKSLDSHCNSDVCVSKIAPLQTRVIPCVACETLDDTFAKALVSSSIAITKLISPSGDVQGISHGNCAS